MTMLFVHKVSVTARAGPANSTNPQAPMAAHANICVVLENMQGLNCSILPYESALVKPETNLC